MLFRFFPLAVILQIFCVYHAYRNNSEQKWYWIILILPFIGSLLYLYHHFYSKQNIENISEGIKEVINTNYTIEKLEKNLKFSETVTNKINLADEYAKVGRHKDAIELYLSCLQGTGQNYTDIIMSLITSYYLIESYNKVIQYSNEIKDKKEFQKSEVKITFAWSLYHIGKIEEAELTFNEMDASYDRYLQRIEFVKFLIEINNTEAALEKANELIHEFETMQPQQKKNKKEYYKIITQLHNQLIKNE